MAVEINQKCMVSVVVPIYNVEQYLNRCIESIVNQTYTNLEILLIDDESPDDCPQICEDWAKKDSRIKVIHKKNEGLGYARNTGIENAQGEYVCFVDSDDWIEQDLVERALQVAATENADLTCYGFYRNDRFGDIVSSMSPTSSLVSYRNEEVQNEFLPNYIGADKQSKIKPIMSACSCLIKKSIIDENHWRFVSEREIISEDVYSLLDLCKYVKVACVMPEVFYHYCINGTSLTHVYRKDRFSKIVDFYYKCILLCEKHHYNETVMERIKRPFLDYTVAAMKQIVSADISKDEKREAINVICNNEVLQEVLRSKPLDYMNWKTKLLWDAVKLKQARLLQYIISLQLLVIRND